MSDTKTIVILGPTAGGKSDLAVTLAQSLVNNHSTTQTPGEIVGADAFQVYRHLDAGTAKPDQSLRERAPHHLIDISEPTERFTVHDWLKQAHLTIDAIQTRGNTPIVVGGTNLYIKALLQGMFDGPGQDPAFRASLHGIDTPMLHAKLLAIDPQTAGRVTPADRQRIIRALEVHELTGKPISELQTQWSDDSDPPADNPKLSNPVLLGLRWSPDAINPRINLRVKAMFYPDKVAPELAAAVCINDESLVDEVKRLKEQGCFSPITIKSTLSNNADAERSEASGTNAGLKAPNQAREALGYKQILAWLEGTDPKITSLDEAYEKTKVLTRRFAKQQRTWLKRFTDAKWIDCDDADADRIAQEALQFL